MAASGLIVGCGTSGDAGDVPQPTPAPPITSRAAPTAAPTVAGSQFGSSGLVVFDGDSLTYGLGADPGNDYPSDVMRRLPEWVDGVNLGVSGQVWPDLLADADQQVDPMYSSQRAVNIVVVWCGTNDLVQTHGAERIWNDMASYCADRKRRGWTVVAMTILATSPPDLDSRYETQRRHLNTIIRSRWPDVADALVDIARDQRIGDPAGSEAAVYYTDGVHHNDGGYAVIADAVTATLQSLVEAAETATPSEAP